MIFQSVTDSLITSQSLQQAALIDPGVGSAASLDEAADIFGFEADENQLLL